MTKAPGFSDTKLTGLPLTLTQIVWGTLVLLSLVLLSIGTWDKFQAPLPSHCDVSVCNPIEFTAEDAAILHSANLPDRLIKRLYPVFNLLFNAGFVAVGLFLGWRRSDDWLALLLSATLITLGGVAFSPANDVLYRTRPVFSPLVNWLQQPAYLSLSILLLIFPDGRFAPRWLRWAAIPLATLPILSYVSNTLSIQSTPILTIPLYSILILVVIYSQIYRYRRVSSPVQRQQTKWGLLGIIGVFFMMVGWSVVAVIFPPEEPSTSRAFSLVAIWMIMICVGLLVPVCFAVAILRYRLWEIDLIIRRTLQYTILTSILAVTYFGCILILQNIFQVIFSQESPMVIVISTLGIAALFTPLRGRIQNLIDRRFYREKYNAEKSLTAFASTARDEVDLTRLTRSLLAVVEKTVQPTHSSLWFKRISNQPRTRTD